MVHEYLKLWLKKGMEVFKAMINDDFRNIFI